MDERYRAKEILAQYPQFGFGRDGLGNVVIADGIYSSHPKQYVIVFTETLGTQHELVVSFAGFGERKRVRRLAQFRFKDEGQDTVQVKIPRDQGVAWRKVLAIARDGLELIKIYNNLSTGEKYQVFYLTPNNPDNLGSWLAFDKMSEHVEDRIEWQLEIISRENRVPWS